MVLKALTLEPHDLPHPAVLVVSVLGKDAHNRYYGEAPVENYNAGLWASEARLCHLQQEFINYLNPVLGILLGPGRDGMLDHWTPSDSTLGATHYRLCSIRPKS